MWKEYFAGLCSAGAVAQEVLAAVQNADLHGSKVAVLSARNPGIVGVSGIVVKDTARTFVIISEDNRTRIVPKEGLSFAVEALGCRVAMDGQSLLRSPAMTPKTACSHRR
mmetsp:Transcript_40118/g.105280  ORF Transcript_40118/g.105280 Transcript_40118/m.105280 type:complete len:110 (+) Transcript_40118:544-873(+)